jgi:hypothetical protein
LNYIEVLIKEARLPAECLPMASLELSTGEVVELTPDGWKELIAKLKLEVRK